MFMPLNVETKTCTCLNYDYCTLYKYSDLALEGSRRTVIISAGGSFFCIVGLLGVGERMVTASDLDPNAADTAVLSTMCLTILLACLLTTLVTGMCWSQSRPW